jgi:hypothetical protein
MIINKRDNPRKMYTIISRFIKQNQPQDQPKCKLCDKTENLVSITEEDLCSPCQQNCGLDNFCVDCYNKHMKYDLCLVCLHMFRKSRRLPCYIGLKLKNPEFVHDRCSTCNVRAEDVMYYPTDQFCITCLISEDKYRYMCRACYNTYSRRFVPCFYCFDTVLKESSLRITINEQ